MKKVLFILLMVSFSFWGMGQELLTNPGFENWNDNGSGGPPDGWTLSGSSVTATQNSGVIHGGTYSTELTWTTTSTRYLQQVVPVTAGNNYEFTFWVYDNDPDGRARVAIRWFDSGDSFISGYYGDYSSDDVSWQQLLSGPQTADVGAVTAHVEIRVYDVSWDGDATVYVDDASFTEASNVIINNAYSLNDDAIDVFYSTDLTSVDAADYILYTDPGKDAVTFTNASIDGSDNSIVHLSGASEPTVGDLIENYLNDNENGTGFDFFAGITPIALTNTNNPSGHIDNGEPASFIGIVSANDNYNNVWISDGSGEREGILIYDYDFDGEVAVGDSILIQATRDEYNGLTELKDPVLITLFSSGNTPYGPAMISGSDIEENIAENTDPAEKWEGQLVSIEHFTVESLDSYVYTCSWSDGRDTYTFFIGDNVDYHLNNITLNVGQSYYHITGVVDYDDVYRINPRNQDDVDDGIYIDVTAPNGGETLVQGTQYDITWDYGEPYWTETEIAIYLSQGADKDLTLITESAPVADGSYTWTVWSSIEPGDDFMIYLESPAGTNDISDDFFSIVPAGELIADFEADTTMIYVGDSVLFTDLSIGAMTSWLWTFEGGTPATFDGQEPPYIHYSEAGTWDVTLEVSDGTSTDALTKIDYITVSEMPVLPPPEDLTGTVDVLDVLLSWTAPGGGGPTGFEDDFESYDDFVLEFAPWTNIDVDGSDTYGMTDTDWPHTGEPQAFIIFNPLTTTPPVEDMTAHSGDKLAACLAAVPSPTNDDWMITPLVNLADNSHLSFWAKSYTDQYGLERFRVGVSTTGMDPADFTIISAGDYVEAPVEDWTEYTYDLSAYNGQQIYVGIQCVSNDAFIFMVDDVYIGADKSSIVFNPAQPVVGKATKEMDYFAQATPQPAATPNNPGLRDDPVLEGYNVYRDDTQLNTDPVTETSYVDVEPSIGTHSYYVTAVYDMGESVHSDTVTIVVTGVDELSLESVSVYPNPSNGKFTVGLPAGADVELNVMDLTGKSVYRSIASETVTIDLNRMYKGMYLLQIYDRNNDTSVVKKLILK